MTIEPERPDLVKSNSPSKTLRDRSYAIQLGMEVTADIISRVETVMTLGEDKSRIRTTLDSRLRAVAIALSSQLLLATH